VVPGPVGGPLSNHRRREERAGVRGYEAAGVYSWVISYSDMVGKVVKMIDYQNYQKTQVLIKERISILNVERYRRKVAKMKGSVTLLK